MLIGQLHYKDSLGRPVFCQFFGNQENGEIVFIDRSDDHNGMSITNSIEQAIAACQEQYPQFHTYFEAYQDRNYVLDIYSLTKVHLENGAPVWERPSQQEGEKWVHFFLFR